MKTFIKIIVVFLIIGILVCMMPAAAFFAIATVDKHYALRVNAFSSVEAVLDDYHTLAELITDSVGEGKISAGDLLYFNEGRLYVEEGKSKRDIKTTSAQKEAIRRLGEFRADYCRVRVYEKQYRFVSDTDPTTLVYSVRGGVPSKTSPENENMHYYTPKAVDSRFYVLVRNPNHDANYFKQGFDIVKMAFEKIGSFLKKR